MRHPGARLGIVAAGGACATAWAARTASLMAVGLSLLALCPAAGAQTPAPVRNDVPRAGQQEVVMMRHAYLEEGSYEAWLEASRSGVWPYFERLGARILGDFEIVYPVGADATPGRDEALRFARYASFEHWQATRGGALAGDTGGAARLGGDGGLRDASLEGLRTRRQYQQGSRGGIFLQGHLAETRPLYMPGLGERYERADGGPDPDSAAPYPVRLGRARPGDGLLALEYSRIRKGAFEEFHAIARDRVWPYVEKIGVRPVGLWRVAYLPNGDPVESEAYDEVYYLARYASFEHFLAVRDDPVAMGGDGPDFEAFTSASGRLNALTQGRSVEFLRGEPYGSPPVHAPGLREDYRLVR